MTIHIFNPDHDHALAANHPNYTPPHAARQLRSDLAFLPSLWADDGDIVVVEDTTAAANALRKLKLTHSSSVTFTTLDQLKSVVGTWEDVHISPWGWDKRITHQLLRAGVPSQLLPSSAQIDTIRALSSRSVAVDILQRMTPIHHGEARSLLCHDFAAVKNFLADERDIVVKAPWSCSGRGIRYINSETLDDNTLRWIQNTIARQGSVTCERKCHKVMDFAVEFIAHNDGNVSANGLSLFSTINGAYTGNMLVDEDTKADMLGEYIDTTVLHHAIAILETTLSATLKGHYTGPLGVDMMIITPRTPDVNTPTTQCMINPCVEINLRRTMGHVALALSRHGQRGTMAIAFEGNRCKMKVSAEPTGSLQRRCNATHTTL